VHTPGLACINLEPAGQPARLPIRLGRVCILDLEG